MSRRYFSNFQKKWKKKVQCTETGDDRTAVLVEGPCLDHVSAMSQPTRAYRSNWNHEGVVCKEFFRPQKSAMKSALIGWSYEHSSVDSIARCHFGLLSIVLRYTNLLYHSTDDWKQTTTPGLFDMLRGAPSMACSGPKNAHYTANFSCGGLKISSFSW